MVAVLSGATHVQILPAVKACQTYLSSHLTLHNCVELEQIAELFSLKELQRVIRCFICQHWEEFSKMPAFLSLSLPQLEGILHSDFPVYCSEVEVLRALLVWVSHDPKERASSIPLVFSLVNPLPEHLLPAVFEQALVLPEVESVVAAYPQLKSLLSSLGAQDVKSVSGVINTRGYFETVLLVGGFRQDSHSEASNSVMYFDADSQTLVPYTNIPHVKQADFGVEVLENCLYVVGGCSNEDFLEVTHPFGFCFDPTSGEWTRLPPMSQERCRFYLGKLGDFLYAVGGEVDNSQLLASCEKFDRHQLKWAPIASLPSCRSELAGTSLGGKLYVSGGMQDQQERTQSQLWCYHPDTDTWHNLAPMIEPRADHTMFTYRNRIYVIGGWCESGNDRTAVTSVDCYDPETNRWQTVQQMKVGRRYCTCTLFQDRVYVIGGGREDGGQLDKCREVEVLDLDTMQWLPDTVSLPPIWEHSTVSLHLPSVAVQ